MAEHMDGSTVEGTPMSTARLRMLKARAEHGHVGHLGRANMLELIHEIERQRSEIEDLRTRLDGALDRANADAEAAELADRAAFNDAHDDYGSGRNT